MKPEKIARKLGVQCGNECRFLDDPRLIFGTEPFLIKLGDHVEITHGCRFITHDGAVWCFRNKKDEYKSIDYFAPIRIGSNTFIGINSVILPGVNIGENCIIGAGSVVTKDIPPNTVAAGVPARNIKSINEFEKKLFTENAIPTKKMNSGEKKEYIMKNHPEWL